MKRHAGSSAEDKLHDLHQVMALRRVWVLPSTDNVPTPSRALLGQIQAVRINPVHLNPLYDQKRSYDRLKLTLVVDTMRSHVEKMLLCSIQHCNMVGSFDGPVVSPLSVLDRE